MAAAAGVSASTVSNYFHYPHKLTSATRDRVRQAVEALGFVPNDAARKLRTGTNPVIGCIAAVPVSAAASEVAHAIEQRIANENMHLLTANVSSEERERSYLRLFEQQRVAGIIIAPIGDVESEVKSGGGAGLGVQAGRVRPGLLAAVTGAHLVLHVGAGAASRTAC
ncbi:LacI family DNA-binding transcriptional regulator [Actinacidiphila glaucinigra]|uniref:LacI family DNA-binding transcriptional regulator n=1 Tax=Actinacidiphila glaucinigra TaxID=235986 RepID=UPI0037C7BBCA